MKRRDLFNTALSGVAVSLLARAGTAEGRGTDGDEKTSLPGIIDCNVSLFRWPFRRLPFDEPKKLAAKLLSLGVTTAVAGSFESLFHRDVSSANARLADACSKHADLLVPSGIINLSLPGWERDLEDCVARHRMPGIRLHPNYHGYTLDDPRFAELLKRAAGTGLLVQIAVSMEDTRTQHPLVRASDVNVMPLPDVLSAVPGAKVQLLNLKPRGPGFAAVAKCQQVYFDTALADGTDGVASLIAATSANRVLYGSHAPFLIPEAALIRVHESNLAPEVLRPLLRENANGVLSRISDA